MSTFPRSPRLLKGAIIGLQWTNYMHGFGGETDDQEPREQ